MPTAERDDHGSHGGMVALAIGALGIVYGDIGTSPLYAFRESFEHADLDVTRANAYGVASVVFWALIVIISIKYLLLVMRADNHGEGGILALTALLMPRRGLPSGTKRVIIALGVFGTALLYGDGLITPAISVLSAVEGFEVASSAFESWVIPVSVTILIALFVVQKRGTERISRVFGPVMILWFVVIAVLGLRQIVEHPGVVRAISPTYGVELFVDRAGQGVLRPRVDLPRRHRRGGAVRRHGSLRSPSDRAVVVLARPAGAGAQLLRPGRPAGGRARRGGRPAVLPPAPEWAITPLAVLATMATVIASQALISGAYSLTAQAVQLDYLPRLAIRHTSHTHIGQIYVPLVNWLLMIGCVALVLGFRSSSSLAAAYGIAVTATMAITTLLFYRVVIDRWGWSTRKAVLVVVPLMLVDLGFLAANIPKIPAGGWLPLLVGVVLVVQMTTWRRGRAIVARTIGRGSRPTEQVVDEAIAGGAARVPGTAIYMFKEPGCAPPALVSNLRHNHVLHETTVVLAVSSSESPRSRLPTRDGDARSATACSRSCSRSGTWTRTTSWTSCT